MNKTRVIIEMLVDLPKIKPEFAHADDACFDIFCAVPKVILPQQMGLVQTGFKMQLEQGWEAQIRPRSGNSLKKNFHVKLGTIDCGYTGEVGVIVRNSGTMPITFEVGDKIAQVAVRRAPQVEIVFGQIETDTERGNGGFGSTDKK